MISSEAAKRLAEIKSKRNVSNAVLARALGVEPWTVGAWLSGTREISEKYKERISELALLPASSDLVVTPLANMLVRKLRMTDEGDVAHVQAAVKEIMWAAGRHLIDFGQQAIDPKTAEAVYAFAQAFDDASLVHFNNAVAKLINERMRVSSLTPEEYAKETIEILNGKSGQVYAQFVDPDYLTFDFTATFDADHEISENAKSVQEQFVDYDSDGGVEGISVFNDYGECVLEGQNYDAAVDFVKDLFVDQANAQAEALFNATTFKEAGIKDQWVDKETYIVSFDLDLNNPGAKVSLYLLRSRLGL